MKTKMGPKLVKMIMKRRRTEQKHALASCIFSTASLESILQPALFNQAPQQARPPRKSDAARSASGDGARLPTSSASSFEANAPHTIDMETYYASDYGCNDLRFWQRQQPSWSSLPTYDTFRNKIFQNLGEWGAVPPTNGKSKSNRAK